MVEYKCVNCYKSFKLKGDYNRHISRKTDCSKELTHVCQFCQKKYINKYSLLRHITCIHTNHIQCMTCSEKITSVESFQKHLVECSINKEV